VPQQQDKKKPPKRKKEKKEQVRKQPNVTVGELIPVDDYQEPNPESSQAQSYSPVSQVQPPLPFLVFQRSKRSKRSKRSRLILRRFEK